MLEFDRAGLPESDESVQTWNALSNDLQVELGLRCALRAFPEIWSEPSSLGMELALRSFRVALDSYLLVFCDQDAKRSEAHNLGVAVYELETFLFDDHDEPIHRLASQAAQSLLEASRAIHIGGYSAAGAGKAIGFSNSVVGRSSLMDQLAADLYRPQADGRKPLWANNGLPRRVEENWKGMQEEYSVRGHPLKSWLAFYNGVLNGDDLSTLLWSHVADISESVWVDRSQGGGAGDCTD